MSNKNENVFDKKAVECSPAKKKKDLYYVHVAIGLAIMAGFLGIAANGTHYPTGYEMCRRLLRHGLFVVCH